MRMTESSLIMFLITSRWEKRFLIESTSQIHGPSLTCKGLLYTNFKPDCYKLNNPFTTILCLLFSCRMSRPPVIRTRQELKAKLALLEVNKWYFISLCSHWKFYKLHVEDLFCYVMASLAWLQIVHGLAPRSQFIFHVLNSAVQRGGQDLFSPPLDPLIVMLRGILYLIV